MRHLNDKKESTIQIINQSKNVLTLKCKSLNQTFKSQVKKNISYWKKQMERMF